MKAYKKNSNKLLSFLLVSAVFLLMVIVPVSFSDAINERQVKIPLVIDLPYAIAGAEFTFTYSTGLEFVSYEKSAVVSSALVTPVVVKNGHTYLGFYNADNRYVSENGKLDMGYLVFNCLTDTPQQVVLTETKLVQVVDSDTTRSEILAPVEIKISSENNLEVSPASVSSSSGTSTTGAKTSSGGDGAPLTGAKYSAVDDDNNAPLDDRNSSVDNPKNSWLPINYWFALVLLFIVACGAGVFIIMKKRANNK